MDKLNPKQKKGKARALVAATIIAGVASTCAFADDDMPKPNSPSQPFGKHKVFDKPGK